MDDKQVTIGEVRAAFERLLDKVAASGCEPEYGQTIYFAGIDVLDILAGKWHEDAAAPREPEAADVLRCTACNQSLREIGRSSFACPTCYVTFGDEEVEARFKSF